MAGISLGINTGSGPRGAAGPSAYDVTVNEGFVGTDVDWLASLIGIPGDPGAAGNNGLSAYEVAGGDEVWGTVDDWLFTLIGADGPRGPDGATGAGVPVGGTTGQALTKASNADFDTAWAAN